MARRRSLSRWTLLAATAAFFSCATNATSNVGEGPAARIESLCHPWTSSPCLLKGAGTVRSERSGEPLVGKRLQFVSGDVVICESTTTSSGYASCIGVAPSGRQVAQAGYRIVFDGDDRFFGASAEGRDVVTLGSEDVARGF